MGAGLLGEDDPVVVVVWDEHAAITATKPMSITSDRRMHQSCNGTEVMRRVSCALMSPAH